MTPSACPGHIHHVTARWYDLAGTVPGSWGIDSFVVSSTPIPEPSTGAMLGLRLGVPAARRRDPATRL